MDYHLYTTKGPSPNTVLWRPREGSSVVLQERDYRPFHHIVRTVHLPDAMEICAQKSIAPKPIVSLSSLKASVLYRQINHPCRKLKIIWFGAKLDRKDEDAHDWYGNIEFAIPTHVIMERWKNLYLVEMMTAPTHTITRILVTNSDYSSVLPQYDPRTPGGPWRLTPDGRHECLADCRRYNSRGYNRHGHTLEFMIEVTPFGMRKILEESTISFRNHELGRSGGHHACHRYKTSPECPTPFTRDFTSMVFFKEHHRLNALQPMATPRLSASAEASRQYFLAGEKIPRNVIQVPPPLSDHHFPPLGQAHQYSVVFSKFLQKRLDDGRMKRHQLVFGFEQDNVFRIIAESILNSNKKEMEEEEKREFIKIVGRHCPRMLHPGMPLPPPPGFPPMCPSPLPLPMGFPPLHLPPPPSIFQHSWAPLPPISMWSRN